MTAMNANTIKTPSRISVTVPPEKIVTSRESTQKAERKNKSCLRRKKTKLCFVAAM